MPGTDIQFSDPITPASVVDQLAARIRARILGNEFKPGEALRQEALADVYKVSRMPIREALRRLEVEGLVVFHPNRGVTVSEVSAAEMSELFDIRQQLEPGLFAQAIERAGASDIAAVEAIRARETAALAEGDTARLGALNREFHAALHAPADRPRTQAIVLSLNQHIDRYVRLQLSLGANARKTANSEHDGLLDALRSRDPIAGANRMVQHIATARRALEKAFAG
ncbi:GntR family transcriptional regulator [uncultured Maricaulis sp.]|uniref:GntR family transcriptional regulator n=1 Tax=uncultured Maricaulis sp. TaxID=174710 RepID=UPI0025D7E0D5|nr:GntR family transcriptional regulator [uncultured Maricaulis sp.]